MFQAKRLSPASLGTFGSRAFFSSSLRRCSGVRGLASGVSFGSGGALLKERIVLPLASRKASVISPSGFSRSQ